MEENVLKLQQSILYGPVNSRRLGKSLGINLMPKNYKLCSFNCVYCQYGWTLQWTMDAGKHETDLPDFDQVLDEIKTALKSDLYFDYLTFSGNGEPTLYPQFPQLVDQILELRQEYRPDAKLALLSNSSGLVRDDVFASMSKIDFPIMKLDAGTKVVFNAINLPAPGIDFDIIVDRLVRMERLLIQTALIDGNPNNIQPQELEAYYRLIKKIRPVEVHLYSIERNVPHKGIYKLNDQRLKKIAREGEAKSGISFKAFTSRQV